MRIVEKLDRILEVAQHHGYQIRYEDLQGGGGVCEFGGQKWIFIDLSQSPLERLEQIERALANEPWLVGFTHG